MNICMADTASKFLLLHSTLLCGLLILKKQGEKINKHCLVLLLAVAFLLRPNIITQEQKMQMSSQVCSLQSNALSN